jgi:glycosyltransferase involved in cell wall biosynthesis
MVVDKKKTKILFVHHTAMWFRRPFFQALSMLYNVEFIFTNVESYNKTYDIKLGQVIPGMDNVNYKVSNKKLGISWGAIRRATGDYDIFIGGSWDTLNDLIETLLYFIIVKLKRRPFILWREDWDWNVQSTKRRLVKILAGFLSRRADAILVPGIKHREFFTKLGVSSEKIFIMPNVSNLTLKDEDYNNQIKLSQEIGLKDEKVILFVGRLIDLKGVQFLLKAFSKLQQRIDNVVLIIVGEGSCNEELENLSQKLQVNDKVYFRGNVDNELLGAYYLLCNVFVLPSITTHHADACPLVVNEAMYFSKPVITSDAVGTTFMIKNGINGYVVPERNPETLCEALYKILSDSELEKRMGEASKIIINEGFTYQNMIDGFNQAMNYLNL